MNNPELSSSDTIEQLLNKAPLKLDLITSIDKFSAANQLPIITSGSIFDTNSTKFHPNGLFSEEIFGSLTDPNRFVNEAAIKLNTKIINPVIYDTVIKKKALYVSIMSGKKYAVFDEDANDLVASNQDNINAGTGYGFFLSNLSHIANRTIEDKLRANLLKSFLLKYRDNMLIDHLIVIPAGLRDMDISSSRLSKDDINKLYLALLNMTIGLSDYALSEDSIFDGIRYQIQLKVQEIYAYIFNVLSDKGGFLQSHYGDRRIAYSTRNVISVPVIDGDSIVDPTSIKADETMVPLLNLTKCFQPFYVNFIKTKLYGELFKHGNVDKVAVIDPKSLNIVYATITPKELNKYTSSDGISRIINRYKYLGFRESPVSITDVNRKDFWILITYRHEDKIFIAKSVDSLKDMLDKYNVSFDRDMINPFTWVEAIYIASENIAKDKHVFVTRYPVLGDGSIYPSKVHVVSTIPSLQITVIFEGGIEMMLPHYPIVGNKHYESIIVHPSRLTGLGADFDGDMCSLTGLWTETSNMEVSKLLSSPSSLVSNTMDLKIRADTDIVKLAVYNLSRVDSRPKQDVLYHGSSIQGLTQLDPNRGISTSHKGDTNRVYAASEKYIAVAFSFQWTNSMGISFGSINDESYILSVPEKHRKLLNSPCSIYTVKSSRFKQDLTTEMSVEYYSKDVVDVISEEKFSSVIQAAKKHNLTIKWI